MAVTQRVSLVLYHNFRSTSNVFMIRRKIGITALSEPQLRDENEDDAVDVVCQHCGATVLVRYGSMASVRRLQARWNVVLALCVVITIAAIAFLASQAGKPVTEGVPLSPFFGLSILGIAVAWVVGGMGLVGRRSQRVATVGPGKAPHSASGRAVPDVATSTLAAG